MKIRVHNGIVLRVLFLALLSSAFFLLFHFKVHHYLTLNLIKEQQSHFVEYYKRHMVITVLLFSFIYILLTGMSVPMANVLSLLGGAMFGVFWGTALVSIVSTIGATLAFLMSRFLFRDWIQKKFSAKITHLNLQIEKQGSKYLFALRLLPVFPFFLINLLMGLTTISVSKYVLASFWGMLPGVFTYVLAGNQLAQIESVGDIFSPVLMVSFTLIGLIPLLSKQGLVFFLHFFSPTQQKR